MPYRTKVMMTFEQFWKNYKPKFLLGKPAKSAKNQKKRREYDLMEIAITAWEAGYQAGIISQNRTIDPYEGYRNYEKH